MHCYVFLGPDIYSAGSGMNRVQVVLSGFSMRLFCFVLSTLVFVCVDVMVMSFA